MGEPKKPATGSIVWRDLTVENAESVKDFYTQVVGWTASPVDMGGYRDFGMSVQGLSEPVAGICHARGTNAGLPPQWLVYITVEDVDGSTARCKELGGEVIVEPKDMGSHGRYSVIKDPAGAVAALFQPPHVLTRPHEHSHDHPHDH